MKRTHILTVLPFLFCAFIHIASSAAQQVESIDGVRIVHNGDKGSWGDNPEVTLQFNRTIGDPETEDENLMLYIPADIFRDAAGNVYVLDAGNFRIQKFDKAENFLASFGQEGQGPGDFLRPISLDLDADGNMYVADQGNRRIQALRPDGRNKDTLPIEEGVGVFRTLSNGNMVMAQSGMFMMRGDNLEETKPSPLMNVFDSEGKKLSDLGDSFDYKEFLLNSEGNKVSFTVDKNDNIFVAFRFQNRIEKYSLDGRKLLGIDRKLNYEVSMPEPDEDDLVVTGGRDNRMVRITMPDLNVVSAAVDVDDKGRIWVVTAERQENENEDVKQSIRMENNNGKITTTTTFSGATGLTKTDMYKIEIYAPDGIFLGAIPLTHFCDGMRIFGDKLYILDQARGMQFYEYTIIEK